MIQIDDKILSFDLFTNKFVCDPKNCKGLCCVHGDSGAPLEPQEAKIIKKIYPKIKSYFTNEGNQAIKSIGTSMIDADGDLVTPLIDKKACAYINYDKDNVAYCGIEKAFFEKKIDFRKPISCHLYPIRVKKFNDFEALNYDRWDVCKPAIVIGIKQNVQIYRFLKEAIIRKYGEEFYQMIEEADKDLEKSGHFTK